MNPFFSIIIPSFNRAHTIGRAILSVVNQTYTDWELVIVDDGSTDNTMEIVESFHDNRIKYVWQENQERSAARNHGIRLANGEWICFLDSDDEFTVDHLFSLNGQIISNPTFKIFRTGLICKLENGEEIKTKLEEDNNIINTYPFDHVVFFAFNKLVFEKFQFDQRFYYMEDMHFLLRCHQEFPFYQVRKWTYIYYIEPYLTGRISKDFNKIILNKNSCIDDMMHFSYNPIKKALIWTKVSNGFIYMYSAYRYDKSKISQGINLNIINLKQHTYIFLLVMLRVVKVKFLEMLGFKFPFRF